MKKYGWKDRYNDNGNTAYANHPYASSTYSNSNSLKDKMVTIDRDGLDSKIGNKEKSNDGNGNACQRNMKTNISARIVKRKTSIKVKTKIISRFKLVRYILQNKNQQAFLLVFCL